MNNQILSKIFYEISEYLKMDEVPFKPYAYQRAAMFLEGLEEDVQDIYDKDGIKGLIALEAIGKSIAELIEEYLKTGKIKYYQSFKKDFL